jgi:hypothetical protein
MLLLSLLLSYSWNSTKNKYEIELNPNTTTVIHSNLIIYKRGVYDITRTFRVSSGGAGAGGVVDIVKSSTNPILIEIK